MYRKLQYFNLRITFDTKAMIKAPPQITVHPGKSVHSKAQEVRLTPRLLFEIHK